MSQLFQQYCCSYYGAPLWLLNSNEVEAVCVAWRKALRNVWKLHPQSHCNIVSALAGIPLKVSLKLRFLKFFNNCTKSKNAVAKSIAAMCISNPTSCAGRNYRYLLDNNGVLKVTELYDWQNMLHDMTDSLNVLREMIDVRDGFKNCMYFNIEEVNYVIEDICVN